MVGGEAMADNVREKAEGCRLWALSRHAFRALLHAALTRQQQHKCAFLRTLPVFAHLTDAQASPNGWHALVIWGKRGAAAHNRGIRPAVFYMTGVERGRYAAVCGAGAGRLCGEARGSRGHPPLPVA